MADISLDFKEALLIDMERKGFTERSLGTRLGITQQAVHRWIERGYPPLSRLDALVDVLGPNSEVGKLGKDKIYTSSSRTVRSAMLPGMLMLSEGMQDPLGHYAMFSRTTPTLKSAANAGAEMASQESLSFGAELPPSLIKHIEKRITLPSGKSIQLDFASDALVAELVFVSASQASANTGNTVLRLVTCAKAVSPNARLILLIVSKDHKVNLPNHVLCAAEAFGIDIIQVRSGIEAARALAVAYEAATTPQPLQEPDE